MKNQTQDQTQVLTIYGNWDVRHKLTFYGRSKYEAMNLLADWIMGQIAAIRADKSHEYDEITPCMIFAYPHISHVQSGIIWLDLHIRDGAPGGIIWRTGGNSGQVKQYDAKGDRELASIYASYALEMGEWETFPISVEDVPEWLEPTAVASPKPEPEPYQPYKVLDIVRQLRYAVYPPSPELEINYFTAVCYEHHLLAFGVSEEEAVNSLQNIVATAIQNLDSLSEWPNIPGMEIEPEPKKDKSGEVEPILAQLPRTGRTVIVFPPSPPYTDYYTAVHTHLGVAVGAADLQTALRDLELLIEGEFKNPVDRAAENLAEALVETVVNPQTAVTKPLGRKVRYVYIGERTPKSAKERTFVWVQIDESRNNGQPMGDDSKDRRYSNGQINLVPEANIGDIYEFTLTNGTDTINKAPAEYIAQWANHYDITAWSEREKIVGR